MPACVSLIAEWSVWVTVEEYWDIIMLEDIEDPGEHKGANTLQCVYDQTHLIIYCISGCRVAGDWMNVTLSRHED